MPEILMTTDRVTSTNTGKLIRDPTCAKPPPPSLHLNPLRRLMLRLTGELRSDYRLKLQCKDSGAGWETDFLEQKSLTENYTGLEPVSIVNQTRTRFRIKLPFQN